MRSTEGINLRRDPFRLWGEKTLSWLPVGLGGGNVPRFKTTPEGWGGGEVEPSDYVEDEEDKDQHHDDYVFWWRWLWRVSILLSLASDCDHQKSVSSHNLWWVVDHLIGWNSFRRVSLYICSTLYLYLYLYPVLRPRVLDRVHIGVHITEIRIIPSWVMRIRWKKKMSSAEKEMTA